MKKVVGVKIDENLFPEMSHFGDLIEIDGPVLSHFIGSKGENFFYYWIDSDDSLNRWLIWDVPEIGLHNYLLGYENLIQLLNYSKDIFVADIDSDLHKQGITLVKLGEISNEYLPVKESYFPYNQVPARYRSIIDKYNSQSLFIPVVVDKGLFSDEYSVQLKQSNGQWVSFFTDKNLVIETGKEQWFIKTLFIKQTGLSRIVKLPLEVMEIGSNFVEIYGGQDKGTLAA